MPPAARTLSAAKSVNKPPPIGRGSRNTPMLSVTTVSGMPLSHTRAPSITWPCRSATTPWIEESRGSPSRAVGPVDPARLGAEQLVAEHAETAALWTGRQAVAHAFRRNAAFVGGDDRRMNRPTHDHRHAGRHQLEENVSADAVPHSLDVRVLEVERAQVQRLGVEPQRSVNVDEAVPFGIHRLEADADLAGMRRIGGDDAQAVRSRERRVEQHRLVGREIFALAVGVLDQISVRVERRRRASGHERLIAGEVLDPGRVVDDAPAHRVALDAEITKPEIRRSRHRARRRWRRIPCGPAPTGRAPACFRSRRGKRAFPSSSRRTTATRSGASAGRAHRRVAGTTASIGRYPMRTTCTSFDPSNRGTSKCPSLPTMPRARNFPAESEIETTAPGIGSCVELSVSVPRRRWASAGLVVANRAIAAATTTGYARPAAMARTPSIKRSTSSSVV